MLSSVLFARSQGATCEGPEQCHWCTAPCTRRWVHDDDPPIPFQRSLSSAKKPSSPWICLSCWIYRRKRVTLQTLKDRWQRDGQCLMNHSWFLTEGDVFIITPDDHEALYETLLLPPLTFSLSLLEPGTKVKNLIQLSVVNKLEKIQADTELKFTYNNKEMAYTVYELEEGLKNGKEGKMPGVRILMDYLGGYKLPGVEEAVKRERGRPPRDYDKLIDGRLVTREVGKGEVKKAG